MPSVGEHVMGAPRLQSGAMAVMTAEALHAQLHAAGTRPASHMAGPASTSGRDAGQHVPPQGLPHVIAGTRMPAPAPVRRAPSSTDSPDTDPTLTVLVQQAPAQPQPARQKPGVPFHTRYTSYAFRMGRTCEHRW